MISDIIKIVPNLELKNSLLEKDYEIALLILAEIFDDFNIFDDEFAIFNSLNSAVSGNYREFFNLAIICEKLFYLDVVGDVISFYDILRAISIPSDGIIVSAFFESLTYFNRFSDVERINYDKFFQKFIDCQDKKYPKLEALETVFSLPLVGDDTDNVLASYVEKLIHGNKVTYEDVYKAILDDDPDSLMEVFLVVKYLREMYYDLKVSEANKLREQAESLLEIGLKREKNT